MVQKTEYEIHVAAEPGRKARAFRTKLFEMGFFDDALAFPGAIYPKSSKLTSCPNLDTHVTWKTFSRLEYSEKLKEFSKLTENFIEGVEGYAHAEIVKPEWDVDIAWRAYNADEPDFLVPLSVSHDEGKKIWDLHISVKVDTLDKRVMDLLHTKYRLYYIDRNKSSGLYRVFTIQGDKDIPGARKLFFGLVEHLNRLGGLEGSAKFEQTTYWQVFGKPKILPPKLTGKIQDYIIDANQA